MIELHFWPFCTVKCCWSRTRRHFSAASFQKERYRAGIEPTRFMQWYEKEKKSFCLPIPENLWYLLLKICNYSLVWHHQSKGLCWLSGIICQWHGRLHPCSWILFAESFIGCQQRFIPGLLIMCQDSGGGRRVRSFDAVALFFTPPTHFSLYHSVEQQHVTSQVCSPNWTTHPTIHLICSRRRLSHTLPVSCKEILYATTDLQIFIS